MKSQPAALARSRGTRATAREDRRTNQRRLGLLTILALAPVVACGATPDGRAEKVGWTSSPVVVCAGGATVEGVDVSEFQGSIDWNAAHGGGLGFAIARVSDGTGHLDPTFSANWSGIKAAGMVRGVYQFFEGTEDGTAQADLLAQQVGALGPGDLPPVADVEVYDGSTGDQLVGNLAAWVGEIKAKLGVTPMIYTAPGFWNGLPNTGQFGGEVLWVANWQVSCPDTPTPWTGWTFWQYDDGTTTPNVPGISGQVDKDRFNGSLSQLQALGGPPDAPPQGWLDSADCTAVAGWSQDPDTADQAINVDVYFDGPAGSGAQGVRTLAGNYRADLCQAIGSCNHGYSLGTPRGLMDGKPHSAYPYGIDSSGNGDNPLLQGAPKSFTCPPPALPFSPAIKRHVTDPTSFSAWQFSYLFDVAHLPDAQVGALAQGPDVPAAPRLEQADDGTPEVWLVDGPTRRHVVSPDSMTAWRFSFSSVEKTPAAQVYALPQGPDWPVAPFLVQGSGPAVYVVDVAPPGDGAGAAPSLPPLPAGGAAGGAMPDAGAAPDASADSDGGAWGGSSDGATGSSSGCSVSAAAASPTGGWAVTLALGAMALLARRRARQLVTPSAASPGSPPRAASPGPRPVPGSAS